MIWLTIVIQPLPCFLPPSCNFLYSPSLILNGSCKTVIRQSIWDLASWQLSVWAQINSENFSAGLEMFSVDTSTAPNRGFTLQVSLSLQFGGSDLSCDLNSMLHLKKFINFPLFIFFLVQMGEMTPKPFLCQTGDPMGVCY